MDSSQAFMDSPQVLVDSSQAFADSPQALADSSQAFAISPPGIQEHVPGARGLFSVSPSVERSVNSSDESPAETSNDAVSDASNDAVSDAFNDDVSEASDDALSEASNEAPVETNVETAVDIPGEAHAPIALAWFFTEKVDHTKDIWAPDRAGDRRLTDWPSFEELSEAGDERALRHKARMLPIPRYHNVDARYDSGYGMNGTSSAVAAGTAQVPYLFRKYAVDLTGPKNRYPIPCNPSEEENARRDPRQARRQRQQEQAVEQGWDSDIEQQFDALLGDNN
ncbi:hypothetical protein PG984_005682 [Apiospora sp. TS-2023a]